MAYTFYNANSSVFVNGQNPVKAYISNFFSDTENEM